MAGGSTNTTAITPTPTRWTATRTSPAPLSRSPPPKPPPGAAGRRIARHQAGLFFPMLLLEGLSLHGSSIRALVAHRGERTRVWWRESLLLAGHFGGYLTAVFMVLPVGQAVAFVAVHQGLLGLYLGCSFAPSHKGMPLLRPGEEVGFLPRQVLTSRNIRGGRWLEVAMGGLNYQIEHHLFPSMPSPSLRRAQPLVRALLRQPPPALPRITPDRLVCAGSAPPARRRSQR